MVKGFFNKELLLDYLRYYSFFIEEFEGNDRDMLSFLFIYLLPFIRSDNLPLSNGILTNAYILIVTLFAITYVGAFHFNPVIRLLFGYRFYLVKNADGISSTLISRVDLKKPKEVQTVGLARNVYLCIGRKNV